MTRKVFIHRKTKQQTANQHFFSAKSSSFCKIIFFRKFSLTCQSSNVLYKWIWLFIVFVFSLFVPLENVSSWNRKYLGKIRHPLELIPFRNQTTQMKTWKNQMSRNKVSVLFNQTSLKDKLLSLSLSVSVSVSLSLWVYIYIYIYIWNKRIKCCKKRGLKSAWYYETRSG